MNEQELPMTNQKLPNATAVLVLGILSIVGTCCYAIPGLIMGIIGLVLAKKDEKLYRANPEMYDNYSNLNTGKILSIIGICIGVLFLFLMIIGFFVMGKEGMMEIIEEAKRNGSYQ